MRYNDLDEIAQEFLKYAPEYAQTEAREAFWKIMDLQNQGVVRNGVYYVVLVDLVGSTKFAATYGNEKTAERIKLFIRSSFQALNYIKIRNIGLFVKEIGDAVLYIFQHFPDIVRWRIAFDEYLAFHGQNAPAPFEIRTCVHIGEIFLEGVNPLSLAVSQVFKMEKNVGAGELVLTDSAFSVAWPTIARAYHGFAPVTEIQLDGFNELVRLHRLIQNDSEDLKRIVEEKIN
ncbi:hypothetical protein LLG95_17750 [bacterium]|nr:hypothetical protein [bacterium]